MLIFYVSLAIFLSSSANAATQVKPCKPVVPGKTIAPSEVNIGECVTPPCAFPRGTDTTITMVFTAEEDVQQVTTNFYGMVGGIKQGYPGIDGTDGCSKLYLMPDKVKTSCPIEKGKTYMFEIFVPVKKAFPKVTVGAHLGVKDKSSKHEIACMETTIKIT